MEATPRKQDDALKGLEEALRESEEKYRSLFASMDQGFCICEMILDESGSPRDYRFLEVNPMFEQHTGLVNASGRTALELVPELEPYWIETYGRVAISREALRFEQRSEPMGSRWFEVYAFPFGPSGKHRLALRFEDITVRKETEANLASLAQRLQLITDAVPALISYVDTEGRYRFINKNYLEWFDRRHEDIEGKLVADVVGEEAYERVRPHLERALSGERVHYENRIPYRNGRTRFVHAEYVPDFRADGSVAGFYAMVIDLSERKRAEEALEQSAQALREADRLKDEFLATLSHELRTPLTSILGWSQLMAEGPSDPRELKTGLDAITRSAKAQMQLIDDVLDVSRITTGNMRLDRRLSDLGRVVEAAVETVRPSAEAKAIDLHFDADPGIEALKIDPDRMQQVSWNLLSNAIKFTPLRGRVDVTLRREGEQVTLAVKDSGPGISPQFLPHIFQRFRQADGSSRRAHSGLGLGLALARDLVELHGGQIDVTSEEGHGARFTVSLPLLSEDPADMTDPRGSRLSAVPAFPGAQILLVDDDPDARAMFGAMLRREGAVVKDAASVAEALEALGRFDPDVLITDIAMPERDGYDLLFEVRVRNEKLPVLALTAQSTESAKGKINEFTRFLSKPIDQKDLIRNVTEALKEPRESV